MDALCFKAGVHCMLVPPIGAAGNGELRPADKPSISAAQQRNLRCGFSFLHPVRPGGKNQNGSAVAVSNGGVSMEEKQEIGDGNEKGWSESWILKIRHVNSLWKGKENDGNQSVKEAGEKLEGVGNCDTCMMDDYGDNENIEFNRESFRKLLRKVPLEETRLYARMSYLGYLAYSLPRTKPGNLLRLRLVTSSMEKKEKEAKREAGTATKAHEETGGEEEKPNGSSITASAAYQIAASAASYLQSHTKSILCFRYSKSMPDDSNSPKETDCGRCTANVDATNTSLMATTDSLTAVVAANEELKQAFADDLNSTHSSPCVWFICDDDKTATRYFVIQGSESLSSWQANLLFEPIQFEGLDVPVHRGIYEAAKGIYDQMLPEIHAHLKTHGNRATFYFTGHSLGGSLSLLINLMLLIREEVPRSSLRPVITFGAPSIMCGGDRLLRKLGLPRNHVQSITMHRDIVPRAFSCNYPHHIAEFLKAINGNFRNLPCLSKQKLLYPPIGELLILQPDDKVSPCHDLLPPGSGLYLLTCDESDIAKAEKQIQAAQAAFLNSPHPLEILSDRSAYGSRGAIARDHDMNSYLESIEYIIRQERSRMRKINREHRRKAWRKVVAPVESRVILSKPVRYYS